LPQTASQIGWRLIFDHNRLPVSQIADIVSDLRRFEVDLRNDISAAVDYSPGYVYATRLQEILSTYDDENTELGAPFGLLLLQLAALVLFFIVVIATLVRRNERREIAMLQSRGAHDRQILLPYSIETLLICTAAALLGPRLAYWLVTRLIPPLIGLDTLIVEIDISAYICAGAVAAVAAIMLIITLIPVHAINDVTLNIPAGQMTAIVGPLRRRQDHAAQSDLRVGYTLGGQYLGQGSRHPYHARRPSTPQCPPPARRAPATARKRSGRALNTIHLDHE
jgi:ABC-type multidrug transport system fused ATPase/permease subunit